MESYYQNTEYVSNSMLSWLKVSPKYFIKKVNKIEDVEEESSAMELGSMIHLALLEPEKFVVSSVDKPTGKMGILCDAILEGKTLEEASELAQFSYKLETVEKKYLESGFDYVTEKLANQDKIFLDSRTKYLVEKCVDAIIQGKESSRLMLENNALNELELFWERDGIKKKGKVDKLILTNLDDNIVFNVDVKTTSSNIYSLDKEDTKSYMYSYLKYGYHRQQAMYDEGIKDYIKEKYDRDVEVIHLHVVVNTTSFESMVYKFSNEWINLGSEELNQLLETYKWHKETNYWETPKDFVDGIVKV